MFKAFIVYIDGMSDSKSINRFILYPLMLKNKSNTFTNDTEIVQSTIKNNITVKKNTDFKI